MLKAPALFLVLRTEPAAGRTIQPGVFADELLPRRFVPGFHAPRSRRLHQCASVSGPLCGVKGGCISRAGPGRHARIGPRFDAAPALGRQGRGPRGKPAHIDIGNSPARVRGHRLRGSNAQGTSRNRAGRAGAIDRLPHRQRCAAPDTVQALQRAGCAGRPASCGRRRCLRRCVAMRFARNAGRTLEIGRQAFGNHGLLQLGCGIRNPGRLVYGARSTSKRLKRRLRNAGTGCGKGGMAFLSGGEV